MRSPLDLAKAANPLNTASPPHLRLISNQFVRLEQRAIKRLIITVPPRHGKSETCSKNGPVWYLGRRPKERVMLVSYGAEFAASWGRKSRDLMNEVGAFYGLRGRDDVAARDAWELAAYSRNLNRFIGTGGGMYTAGIGGPLTGKPGNLIIIDDPVKNAEEAFSSTYRENTWDWFQSTLYSRLEPNAVIVLIQTRWHEDDLAGRLISQSNAGGEHWDVINLPALAEEGDPLGRAVGEALWPERYSVEDLKRIEGSVGSYWFAALYQQRPIPVGKGLFQAAWEKRFTETEHSYLLQERDGSKQIIPKVSCTRFSTMDLAASTKTTADYTVISTFALTPNQDLLLLNVQKVKMEGPDQLPLIQSVYMNWRPAQIYIESVGYQLTMIQGAVRAGLPILPITPDKDKISRALAASARMEIGKVYFPEYADWLLGEEGFLTELYRFPAAKHDDQVDTLAYAAFVQAGLGYVGNFR
jgi:predicted phage terminase large subunit-like protein